MEKKILLISTFSDKKFGMGHLKRSINTAKALSDFFYPIILINNNQEAIKEIEKTQIPYIKVYSKKDEIETLNKVSSEFIIIDKRDTSFYKNIKQITVAVDNYGKDTDYFDFLFSPLPYIKEFNSNFSSLKYLVVDPNIFKIKKKQNKNINNILVSFGGSDPNDLSFLAKNLLEEILITRSFNIKIILGPLYNGRLTKEKIDNPNIKIEGFKDSLYSEIEWADLVITSFGITAIESLIANRLVFVIDPTDYHNMLSKKLKIPSVIGDHNDFSNIKNMLNDFIRYPFSPIIELPESNSFFASVVKDILANKKSTCPVCNNFKDRIVVHRNGVNNVFFCKKDKIIFRNETYFCDKNYGSEYFLSSYKKQYGKTYEEDRGNIDRLNRKRINVIKRLLGRKSRPKLLEVGSALGFFLDMARNSGFIVKGVEISKYGSDYSKNILKLDVINSSFTEIDFEYPSYDVVSMWYFIEHIKDMEKVILKIKKALKVGGILALSTPNCYGITGRKNIKEYAKKIPDDHYYEFSPRSLTKVLEKYGFEKLKVVYTGCHPVRLWDKIPKFLYPVIIYFIKIFGLGDTFEAYYRLKK